MNTIRRQLLKFLRRSHTFEIIAESSYVGKVFYCTCKYDHRQVFGTWSISYGDQFASINENGRVDIYEGVENELDEKRCIEMSAKYLQGYKYSRPIPIERLTEFFEKRGNDR